MRKQMVSLLILLAILPGSAEAQNTITEHAIASGGFSNGPAIHSLSAIGQTVAGSTAGGSFRVCAGFDCGVATRLSGSATAVFLSYFDVTLADHQVALDWGVLSAAGLEGFNVYRAEAVDGSFVQINEGLLRATDAGHFVDRSIEPDHQYVYRLGAIDGDGEFTSEDRLVTTPSWVTELRPSYPNPFNPRTKVSFYLATAGSVRLTIFDERGREVTTLLRENLDAGDHVVPWDGTDARHRSVSSGIYYARLSTETRTLTSKMTLLK